MPRTVTDDELFHSPPKFPNVTPGLSCLPSTTSCTQDIPDQMTSVDEIQRASVVTRTPL